jgi:hypothetical protein
MFKLPTQIQKWLITSIQKENKITIRYQITQLSVAMTKLLRKSTAKEQRFTLAHSVTGFRPWSIVSTFSGPVVRQNIVVWTTDWRKAAHFMAAREERDRGHAKVPIYLQSYVPMTSLPSITPHILKVPPPLTSTNLGTNPSMHMAFGDI